jgi:excisionase family DNA binding protein
MIRVSISEAGRLFGISTKTIRLAIKDNQIKYIIVRNRYRLNFESVLSWSQIGAKRRNKLNNTGIGQYVDKWKITNRKYSPNPRSLIQSNDKGQFYLAQK